MHTLPQRFQADAPVTKLQPHPRNARQGDTGAIHQSIEQNGFFGACLAQKSTGYILAGSHRFLTARSMGAETVPVLWVDCDDQTALRILLADNRVADLADYDMGALADLLDSVRMDMGFEGTGWDAESFQNVLDDLEGLKLGDLTDTMTPAEPRKPAAAQEDSDVVRSEVFTAPDAPVETPVDKEADPAPAPVDTIRDRFQVLVDCTSEAEQTELLDLLMAKGHACRALVG